MKMWELIMGKMSAGVQNLTESNLPLQAGGTGLHHRLRAPPDPQAAALPV